MFKIIVFYFFFFTSNFLVAQSNFKIQAFVEGFPNETFVTLFQYNNGEVTEIQTTLKSGFFDFNISNDSFEGVCKIIINYPYNNSNNIMTYQFDLIVDKAESEIKFFFNPIKSDLLIIEKSEINKNLYNFLASEKFRLNVLSELRKDITNGNTSLFSTKQRIKEILVNEIADFKQMRSDFITANFNKWSTYIVKNSVNQLYIEDIDKDLFWNLFDTNNRDLMNTSLFEEIMQMYLINYYSSATDTEYMYAFKEIVKHFEKDPLIKKWAVNHIAKGMNQENDIKLIDYLSN